MMQKNIVTPSVHLLFYQRWKLSTKVSDNAYMYKVITHHMQHWSYKISQTARTNSNELNFVMKQNNEMYWLLFVTFRFYVFIKNSFYRVSNSSTKFHFLRSFYSCNLKSPQILHQKKLFWKKNLNLEWKR